MRHGKSCTMISDDNRPQAAFVWVWLPGAVDPVVAGRLEAAHGRLRFNYGRSYLDRDNAIAIYDAELPLKPGALEPLDGLSMPGCIRDGAPDAWGRRVIIHGLSTGGRSDPDELTFLLASGSDRIGALDFQRSATSYAPRCPKQATIDQLLEAAERVDKGAPLTPDLEQALFHGTSIGGARPKALIEDGGRKYVAKFSTGADLYHVVKAEFIAMRLARRCGLNVASVLLAEAAGKDVLLVERFDRVRQKTGWARRSMVSALTLFGLDEMMARYASYQWLAEIIRRRFTAPGPTLKALFARLVFNILCGNTDDHARNHAAFWDGAGLTLTPAYDICPQSRVGREASQAMRIAEDDNLSRIRSCLDAARHFQLTEAHARQIVEAQIDCIKTHWRDVCDEANLPAADRNRLWERQFLNPFAFEGY